MQSGGLRVELAGYWSRLLVRVKDKAKSSTEKKCQKSLGHELYSMEMLTGDRAKYLGLIFAIALLHLSAGEQTSIFASILNRTGSQILDVTDAMLGDGCEDRIFRANQGAEGH